MDIYMVKGLLRWIIKQSNEEYLKLYKSVIERKEKCCHIDSDNFHPDITKIAEIIVVYGDKCGNCGPTVRAVCHECSLKLSEHDWWGTSQCEGLYIVEFHDLRNDTERKVYSYNEYHKINELTNQKINELTNNQKIIQKYLLFYDQLAELKPPNNNNKNYYVSDCYDKDCVDANYEIKLKIINKKGLSLAQSKQLAFEEFGKMHENFPEPEFYAPKNLGDINVVQNKDATTINKEWRDLTIKTINDKLILLKYGSNKNTLPSNNMTFNSIGKYHLVEKLGYGTTGGFVSYYNILILQKI